jgi:hypothetical protein
LRRVVPVLLGLLAGCSTGALGIPIDPEPHFDISVASNDLASSGPSDLLVSADLSEPPDLAVAEI